MNDWACTRLDSNADVQASIRQVLCDDLQSLIRCIVSFTEMRKNDVGQFIMHDIHKQFPGRFIGQVIGAALYTLID